MFSYILLVKDGCKVPTLQNVDQGDAYHSEGRYVTSSYFLLNNSPTCVSISFVLNTGFFVTRGQTKDTIAKMEAQNGRDTAMLNPITEQAQTQEDAPPKGEAIFLVQQLCIYQSYNDSNALVLSHVLDPPLLDNACAHPNVGVPSMWTLEGRT